MIIHFSEVQVGDRLTFTTRDNGFGGSGGQIERTGTVTRKTDRVVDLYVGGGTPVFKLNSRGRGMETVEGATARLRKADWYNRSPRRAEEAM